MAPGTAQLPATTPGTIARFLRNGTVRVSLLVLSAVILTALLSDVLMPQDPFAQDLFNRFQGPTRDHLLGTDSFGRDQLSRLILATRVSLVAAAQALAVAAVGIPVGLAAGQIGGLVDGLLSRITDGFLAIPPLILALAIIGILGRGLTNAMIALGIVLAPRFFRIARAETRVIVREVYIEAARADGASGWTIAVGHVLPNASGPLLVQGSFTVGLVIIAEAGLSFLGLGAQTPISSWGSMIRESFEVAREMAWPIIPPSLLVTVTILSLFLVGDGFRDALGTSREQSR